MFIDETIIEVTAGDGGDGCFSYGREKFKPRGKPNGGNGGRGANVIVEVSSQVHTLQDVSYRRFYKAPRGGHGLGSDMYGRKGEDIVLLVPQGTIISEEGNPTILADCIEVGKQYIIAKGGRGGRGNAALTNRNNPNPDRAEDGKPGEHKVLNLTLKVLADVGLVGRPNAGKSTFLSTVSKAHPKIADYPFTTLKPNLGIVKLANDYRSFVIADIPGIIEGSNEGKGLGIQFLRHIERTRVLAIMVDVSEEEPEKVAEALIHELTAYSPILAEKPKCFILTKKDLVLEEELPKLKGWHTISSATKEGTEELIHIFKDLLDSEKTKY